MAIAGYKLRSRVTRGDRELEVAIESYNLITIASVKSRSRGINWYCYLLTWIESKSNRKLLSGNEKYRDVPYGPPQIPVVEVGNKLFNFKVCLSDHG